MTVACNARQDCGCAERIRAATAGLEQLDRRMSSASRSNQRSYWNTPQAHRRFDRMLAASRELGAERLAIQRNHHEVTGVWLNDDGDETYPESFDR